MGCNRDEGAAATLTVLALVISIERLSNCQCFMEC
jgi:hypothetical protein